MLTMPPQHLVFNDQQMQMEIEVECSSWPPHVLRNVAACHWNRALIVKGLHRFLSRREHAPDRKGALNNKVWLITQLYSILHE